MRKSVIAAIALLAVFVAVIATIFAVREKESLDDLTDPVATKQYVNGEFIAELLNEITQPAQSRFNTTLDEALSEYKNSEKQVDTTQRFTAGAGYEITVKSGGWIIMQSGAAVMTIDGEIGNITKGEVVKGTVKMQVNHKYVVYPDSELKIQVDENANFVSGGSVAYVNNVSLFSDMETSDWCYNYVLDAVNLGIMAGNSDGTFNPYSNVTLADAITYAAEMNQLKEESEITLKVDSDVWYKNYLDYAVEKSIVDSSYSELSEDDMNSAISRKEIAYIFASALSDEYYEEIVEVNDGDIADVDENSTYGKYIYKLYRAGILAGSDDGNFKPNEDITRAEVAVIIDNIMNPELRNTDNQ